MAREAGSVPDVVGCVVQDLRLSVPRNRNDRKAKRGGQKHGQKQAHTLGGSGSCSHRCPPCRYTRRRLWNDGGRSPGSWIVILASPSQALGPVAVRKRTSHLQLRAQLPTWARNPHGIPYSPLSRHHRPIGYLGGWFSQAPRTLGASSASPAYWARCTSGPPDPSGGAGEENNDGSLIGPLSCGRFLRHGGRRRHLSQRPLAVQIVR